MLNQGTPKNVHLEGEKELETFAQLSSGRDPRLDFGTSGKRFRRYARGGPHTYIIQQISDPIVVVFDTSGVVNSGRFLVAPRATKKCRIRAHEKRIFWIIRNRKFYSLQLRTIFRPFS